jgi:hypothetical protein
MRIRMDMYYCGKLDPNPHWSEKLDPEPNDKIQKLSRFKIELRRAMDAHNRGLEV